MATLEVDHDDLVLELPHPTHGYTEDHDSPATHETPSPPRRLRHWKQTFWKRRTNERRRRNRAYGDETAAD